MFFIILIFLLVSTVSYATYKTVIAPRLAAAQQGNATTTNKPPSSTIQTTIGGIGYIAGNRPRGVPRPMSTKKIHPRLRLFVPKN